MKARTEGVTWSHADLKKTCVRVTQIMRPRGAEFFSIERVYKDIIDGMPINTVVSQWVCPYASNGVIARLRGAIAASKMDADVFHVTGHAHYLTYFLPKKKTVLTVHDCEFLEREAGVKRWLLWLLWFWLPEKRCCRIVTVSEDTRRRLEMYLRCDAKKIQVIHNPVSETFWPVSKRFNLECPRILQIGTKSNKNLERLAEALSGLSVHLSVVGNLKQRQVEILSRFGISYEAKTGLSEEALRGEYERCDIVALCSTSEGFGLPIVEGQAVGRPVVTSARPPMSDVAGAGACLVDPENVSDIRRGFQTLFKNSEYRKKLIENGFDNVERFRVKHVAEQYDQLYREVANGACWRSSHE